MDSCLVRFSVERRSCSKWERDDDEALDDGVRFD